MISHSFYSLRTHDARPDESLSDRGSLVIFSLYFLQGYLTHLLLPLKADWTRAIRGIWRVASSSTRPAYLPVPEGKGPRIMEGFIGSAKQMKQN